MQWYAETPGRRGRQLVADVAMVVWALVWWRIAAATHDLVAAVGAPGRGLAATGERLATGFRDVAGTIGATPVVGDALGAPFEELAGAATGVASVGTAQDAAAGALADWTAVVLFALTVGVIGGLWLAVRIRGARDRRAAARLRDAGHDDLLALRALATRPLAELVAAAADPVGAWQRGETRELAAVELRRVGLRGAP